MPSNVIHESQANVHLPKVLKKQKENNSHKSNVVMFTLQSVFKGVSQNITVQSVA